MRKACENCSVIGISPFCANDEVSRGLVESEKIDRIILKKKQFEVASESANSIFIVSTGVVFLKTSFDGITSHELLYPGTFFGGYGHTGTSGVQILATAATDALICEVKDATIMELVRRDSRFIRKYLATMGIYLHSLKLRANEPNTIPLNVRLCKALHTDFKKRGEQYKNLISVTKLLTHEEWGLHLGARRESISRVFNDLEAKKIVGTEEGLLVLHNENELLKLINEPSAPSKKVAS